MKGVIDIAKKVLYSEAESIKNLIKYLDKTFVDAIELIASCKGRVVILGVGKSGHIGKKIAATLASTGQPSFFIHPTEAVHGDLGMMISGDVCLLISHSGNTIELIETIPAIKRLNIPIISITSGSSSKLAKYSTVVLNTHVEEEACPFNLAPTNSTTVTLAYGDCIAISLFRLRGLKEEDFAMRHPAGILGKKLLTKVSDVMIDENLPKISKEESFRKALETITRGKQGVTLITDVESKCIGILTDGDIRRIFEKYERVSEIELAKVYSKNPKSIGPDVLAVEALRMMQDNKITSLVVLDDNKSIVGIIHIHHLIEKGFL